MKRILLLVLFAVFCCHFSMGQDAAKLTRRIYLWDVTLSMKGYEGKTPNIYGDVVDYLEKCINEVKDESTEIYVLPFQESVLETWKANATVEGKKYLIDKIKSYKNDKVTNTNISEPIKYVKDNIISKSDNRHTFFALLTDGKQSDKFGGMQALIKELKAWDSFALEKHSYLLYVMLTPEAEDPGVTQTLGTLDYGEAVHSGDSQLDALDLMPKSNVKVNLLDDKYIMIPVSNNSSVEIPQGIKLHYTAIDEQKVISMEGDATLENGAIKIAADYGMPVDSLKLILPEIKTFALKLEITNKDEIKEKGKMIVLLTNTISRVELINKPEKTLKISIKKGV